MKFAGYGLEVLEPYMETIEKYVKPASEVKNKDLKRRAQITWRNIEWNRGKTAVQKVT